MYTIEDILEFPELQPHAEEIGKELDKIGDLYYQLQIEEGNLEIKKAHALLHIFDKQREIYKTIPEFWSKFFTNYEGCTNFLFGQDMEAISYLNDVSFHFSSTEPLHFTKNPYFKNQEVTLDISQKEDGTLENKPFDFEWLDKGDIIEAVSKDLGQDSFFSWFTREDVNPFVNAFVEPFGKYHDFAFPEDIEEYEVESYDEEEEEEEEEEDLEDSEEE